MWILRRVEVRWPLFPICVSIRICGLYAMCVNFPSFTIHQDARTLFKQHMCYVECLAVCVFKKLAELIRNAILIINTMNIDIFVSFRHFVYCCENVHFEYIDSDSNSDSSPDKKNMVRGTSAGIWHSIEKSEHFETLEFGGRRDQGANWERKYSTIFSHLHCNLTKTDKSDSNSIFRYWISFLCWLRFTKQSKENLRFGAITMTLRFSSFIQFRQKVTIDSRMVSGECGNVQIAISKKRERKKTQYYMKFQSGKWRRAMST